MVFHVKVFLVVVVSVFFQNIENFFIFCTNMIFYVFGTLVLIIFLIFIFFVFFSVFALEFFKLCLNKTRRYGCVRL